MQIVIDRSLAIGEVVHGAGAVIEVDATVAMELTAMGRAVPYSPVTTGPAAQTGLVTCIMPTKNRRQFVPRAIELFMDQTYEQRELLIVDNGESIKDLVPSDPRITYTHTAVPMKLGALRNFCCGRSNAEFIAHWDDDDWYHPFRLQEQVEAIKDHDVTTYWRCYFDGDGIWKYSAWPGMGVGSSLMYRKSYWLKQRFVPLQVGEDVQFIRAAGTRVCFTDGLSRLVASIHKGNTSPRFTAEDVYKPATPADLPPEYFT